jgi:hypothetical protein
VLLFTFALALALAGCVTQQLETTTQSITLPEQTDSVFWNPKTNVGSDIWPAGQGITSTQIMIRKGPDGSTGATFIAFVIWNGNFVGNIFRVHVGADGADFHQAAANITSTRTFGFPDHSTSSGGNPTTGSGTPLPHPNVDGTIHYSPSDLTNVKTNAAVILNATNDFMNFTEAPLAKGG